MQEWPEWVFFNTVNALLADVVAKTREADSHRVGALYPFLDSVRESATSLQFLVIRQALRDSYVIARVIYETAVNACFLLTSPIELSARANAHAKQKTLRSLVRRIEIAGTPLFEFKYSGADELMQEPEHKKLLDEFTSKSGREISSWTSENVQQRLDAVHLAFGAEATKGLAFGLLMYRHASEIAHGTLYGTLFSWGALAPNRPLKSPGDLGIFRRAELRHLLKLVCFSLESLVRVTSSVLDAPSLGESAERALQDYYKDKNEGA
ncbi:DUF5677 domain-containing protein [Methyloversatilis discipulorum]|uniref:DUF5677 domain-containing protein n=1 Tax=Methyloversatilis discipulorum TaxID=1119528 RepID=UPI001E2D68DE|nr:DUF5677 domain-containing protein [Methyloversatilis discipulorum]